MIKMLTDLRSVAKYLKRIGAEPRSMRTAVVRENNGNYWRDVAVIRFEKNGEVLCPDPFSPTPEELGAIKEEFATAQFPEHQTIDRLQNLPPHLADAKADDLFIFHDEEDKIVMVQHRIERKGEKSYIPYTFWSDGVWRPAEPEGSLPLWGVPQLKQNATVFIHEGAKAARAIARMIAGATPEDRAALLAHPWGEELSHAAHVGWIGGALSPHRTDWSVLSKAGIKRAYIVSDNDAPGVAAVSAISYHLRIPTFHVQFTNEWPGSFDLADPWPEAMFSCIEGERHYVGPSFRSCLHPATWATDQVTNKKGKPTTVLRDSFRDMWAYVEDADIFVCIEMPDIIRTEPVMNKMLAAFSHSNHTSQLMVRSYQGRSVKLCYRPDMQGRLISNQTSSAINLHTPTLVKMRKGSAKPFLDFMEYMLPIESERNEALRWCATLIARPWVRMEYGMLMVSETQGIGKTTLGSAILAPLVGTQNCSWPTEMTIVQSEFNDWLANKRLVIVNEIYSGHSWKAYNKLKSTITDMQVEVNQKYQRRYVTENWCHIFACSNSTRALKMEEDDRRWFYPSITEHRWPRDKFTALYDWLRRGGLSFIRHWAEHHGQYVNAGERAPITERKRELIAGSRTEAQKEAYELAMAMNEITEPIAIAIKDVMAWARDNSQGVVFDTDYQLQKVMKDAGCIILGKRIKIGGRMQTVILNKSEDWRSVLAYSTGFEASVREKLRKPNDILESSL